MERDASHKQQHMNQYLLRRRAVLQGGVALAAALAAPGLIRKAAAAPAEPLHFVGWQYNPQIVAENVDIFKQLYDENVEYELVPGEYHAIAETKLIAGQHIDMMYSEEDHLVRWNRAGWIRDVEGLPGIEEIKAKMYEVNVQNMTLPNGKLAGLPYYAGFNSFVCNEKHLEQAKIEPPTTWDELLEQCRKLKADGCPSTPTSAAWGQQWASLSWSLFSIWYSEGAKVFDANNDPMFDEPSARSCSCTAPSTRRSWWSRHLHPAAGGGAELRDRPAHLHGGARVRPEGVQRRPACSQIAGACKNAIMPGATRSTFIWTALYQMGADPVDVERAWNLMQFFGGKAKDGEYHVAKRWALEFGLGTPYKEVIEDPEVQAAYSKWKDLEVSKQQQETATTRDVAKTMWFPEWDWYMMAEAQDYIRGEQSEDELVDKLHAKARAEEALSRVSI